MKEQEFFKGRATAKGMQLDLSLMIGMRQLKLAFLKPSRWIILQPHQDKPDHLTQIWTRGKHSTSSARFSCYVGALGVLCEAQAVSCLCKLWNCTVELYQFSGLCIVARYPTSTVRYRYRTWKALLILENLEYRRAFLEDSWRVDIRVPQKILDWSKIDEVTGGISYVKLPIRYRTVQLWAYAYKNRPWGLGTQCSKQLQSLSDSLDCNLISWYRNENDECCRKLDRISGSWSAPNWQWLLS